MSEQRDAVLHAPLHRALWSLAWPIVVSNELTVLIGAIELFWLAHFIGGSGLAVDSMYRPFGMLASWGMASTAVGSSSLVSRSVGAADGKGLSIAAGAITLTLVIWLAVLAVALPLSPQLARLLSGALAIDAQMLRYLLGALLLAVPAAALMEVLLEVANATGNTRFNIIRVAIDLVFTAALAPTLMFVGLGIAGAPVSLGLAALALTITLWITLVRRGVALQLGQLLPGSWGLRWSLWKELLAIGVPVQAGRVVMFGVQIILMRLLARAGDADVAGYGIACAVIMFGAMATMGFAQAAGILIGQSLGAGLSDRARSGVRTTLVMAWVTMAVFVGATWFDRSLIHLFTSDVAITNAAARALSIMRWGLFGAATWQILLSAFGAYRATVRAGLLMLIGEAVGLAVAYLWPGPYLDAVAVSFIASHALKAVLLAWLFARRPR